MDNSIQRAPVMDAKLVPPSTLLPPIRKALELPSQNVSRFVTELTRIYTPEVLGTRFEVCTPVKPRTFRKRKTEKNVRARLLPPTVDSGYASLVASEDEGEDGKHRFINTFLQDIDRTIDENQQSAALENAVRTLAQDLSAKPKTEDALEEQLRLLRSDTFERSYAMNWLTGLIARSAEWVELGADDENDNESESEEFQNRERIVEKASALLAACSGSSASGALTRSFTFQPRLSGRQNGLPGTVNTDIQFQIHLKDDSLPAQDHTAVGLQTWGSAPILAQLISDCPQSYGLDLMTRFDGTGRLDSEAFKVLELGAGTGLMSLFTWRLLEQQIIAHQNHSGVLPQCSVLATDYHPSVLSNLNFNLSLNPPSPLAPSFLPFASIDAGVLDWNSCVALDEADRFDIVFGADIIYEQEHAKLVKGVVEKVLKRPLESLAMDSDSRGDASYSTGGLFWLIYPLRPTHEVETRSIETVFGEVIDAHTWPKNVCVSKMDEAPVVWRLGVLEKKSLERRKGIGRADEVSYRVFKMGWVAA